MVGYLTTFPAEAETNLEEKSKGGNGIFFLGKLGSSMTIGGKLNSQLLKQKYARLFLPFACQFGIVVIILSHNR